jgi:hypothetical protein
MEGLFALDELTPAEANRTNYCRLFVGAYLASDIVSPDGTTILSKFFKGHLAQRANKPMVMIPWQARPDVESWKQWRRALRLLFTKPRCSKLTLLEPLGLWFPPRHDSHTWRSYTSGSKLIIHTGFTSVLTEYSSTSQRRRHKTYLKTTARIILTLPENSVPIDLTSHSRHHWSVPIAAGHNAIPPVPIPPPGTTFEERVSELDVSLRDLLKAVVLLQPLQEIAALLRTNATLTLVGDGGAKTCRGSFGAVAAIGVIRIMTVKGPATGTDPRSYRAEAYAMAAIVLVITILLVTLSLPLPCQFSIELYRDNQ